MSDNMLTDQEAILKQLLDYEIFGSWVPQYIPANWEWLQSLAAWYYLHKTRRKYNRYCKRMNRIIKGHQLSPN